MDANPGPSKRKTESLHTHRAKRARHGEDVFKSTVGSVAKTDVDSYDALNLPSTSALSWEMKHEESFSPSPNELQKKILLSTMQEEEKLDKINDDNGSLSDDSDMSSCPQIENRSWTSIPQPLQEIKPIAEQKLLVSPPSDPYDAFRKTIDDDFLDFIILRTNAYASKIISSDKVIGKSTFSDWKDLTRNELLIFLGLMLHTGSIQLDSINDYWKSDYLFNLNCFRLNMSRVRFLKILQSLSFTLNYEDDSEQIVSVVNLFNRKMKNIYHAGKKLSIDTSVIFTDKNILFREAIRGKTFKYGKKLHTLAEADGTVLKYYVSECAAGTPSGKDQAYSIALKLLKESLDRGHHVYMGSFYSSFDLAAKLLQRKTYCTGILKKNREGNPEEIKTVPLAKDEIKTFYSNGVCIGKWKDRRYYLSSKYVDETIQIITKKPQAIERYDLCMAGLRLRDEILPYYPLHAKSLPVYKKLFIYMLLMSVNNALRLYNKFSGSKQMKWCDFRLELLERLVPSPPEIDVEKKHELTKMTDAKVRVRVRFSSGGRKQGSEVIGRPCKACELESRVMTTYECKLCAGSPAYCKTCFYRTHKTPWIIANK